MNEKSERSREEKEVSWIDSKTVNVVFFTFNILLICLIIVGCIYAVCNTQYLMRDVLNNNFSTNWSNRTWTYINYSYW
jgi:hypothetical protein